MPALWIAQLLCPARHALCGLAYDAEVTPTAEIDAHLQTVRTQLLNPWCGICGSRELHVEHGKLRTNDWDEATVLLRATEQANLRTRAILGEPGRN